MTAEERILQLEAEIERLNAKIKEQALQYLSLDAQAAALQEEAERLRAERDAIKAAYRKMRNAAAGYSNFCEDSASARRCERDYEEGERLWTAAIDAAKG